MNNKVTLASLLNPNFISSDDDQVPFLLQRDPTSANQLLLESSSDNQVPAPTQPVPQLPVGNMPLKGISVKQSMNPSSLNYGTQFDNEFKKGMEDRKAIIQALQSKLENAQGQTPEGLQAVNLAPALAFADSITGGNSAAYYKDPQALEKYKAEIEKLQAAVSKEANGISDDELNYLKQKAQEQREARVAAQFGALDDYRNKRLGLIDDGLALKVGKQFDSDPILKTLQINRNQMNTDFHTLMSKPDGTITLDEIQKGIANAISGTNHSTVSDTQAMKFKSALLDAERLQQYVLGKPTTDVLAKHPELKQMMQTMIERLDDAYRQNTEERLNTLKAGGDVYSSSKAKDMVNRKYDEISGKRSVQQRLEDSSHDDGSVTVTDGKRTFKIDKEGIKNGDLDQALKAGFKEVK